MTTAVQMLKTRPDGSGGHYVQGSQYSLPDDLATFFIRNGAARLVTVESEETGAVATLNPDGKRYDLQDGDLDPVFARKSVTGRVGFNGTIIDMDETPDDINTAAYPVGTLFISPES